MLLRQFSLSCAAIVCSVTGFAGTVTTYTYQGHPFTYGSAPFTTTDEVTGFFTAPTLADNLPETDITSTVLNFKFSDVVTTNSGVVPYLIVVKTDALGDIVAWDVREIVGPVGTNTGIFTCYNSSLKFNSCGANTSDSGYLNNGAISGGNQNLPGTWTSSTAGVPEPTSPVTLGIGLSALFLGVAWRHRQARTTG